MLGGQSWIRVNLELNLTKSVRRFETMYSIMKHKHAIKMFPCDDTMVHSIDHRYGTLVGKVFHD